MRWLNVLVWTYIVLAAIVGTVTIVSEIRLWAHMRATRRRWRKP